MTSLRSSGSSRCDIGVESTRSQNIVVKWRRSPACGSTRLCRLGPSRYGQLSRPLSSSAQKPLPLPEREAQLAKISLGQLADRARIDVVRGEHVVEVAETKPVQRRAEQICHAGRRRTAAPGRPLRSGSCLFIDPDIARASESNHPVQGGSGDHEFRASVSPARDQTASRITR